MKKITILHTIETSGPGGAENVLLQLVSRLDPKRFRSVVVINESGWLEDRLLELGLPTVRVKWNRWWDFRLPRALARLVCLPCSRHRMYRRRRRWAAVALPPLCRDCE